MKKFIAKSLQYLTALLCLTGLAPLDRAQTQSSVTRVYTVPNGGGFYVDGQYYNQTASFIWPAGSKHTLNVNALIQDPTDVKTQYTFANWAIGGTTLTQNPLIVTADPSISEIHANFAISYLLYIRYYPCGGLGLGVVSCQSPGTVYVNGVPTVGNYDVFLPAGSTATLQATPIAGYVFSGWQPGFNQVIQGFLDTVTMNAPVGAYPGFQVTRAVNLATDPPGLSLLVDRTPVPTPATMEWAWDSAHSVSPISPQQDNHGLYWAFSAWSDNGASTHAYQVAELLTPDTLSATFVRAEAVAVVTAPPGLKVKVDGRDNWPSNTFLWGVNETHHLEAAAYQTDAQGRGWSFTGWSNGAAGGQDFVVPANSADSGVTLTASYQPLGRLTVTSSLAGVAVQVDGSNCNTPCDVQRPLGTQVHVSAPASEPMGAGTRADFAGWSDGSSADRVLTLGNDALTLAANYRALNQLTAQATPPEGATWQMQPSSPDGFYDSQATVKVSLTTLPGFRFRQWDGDLSGSSPSGVVAMNAPRNVRALLDRVPYIAPAGVENAAASTPQPGIAPGSIASIFGGGLGTDTALGPPSPLVQSLIGVTVTSGDRILPLFFVSPTQINFLLPADFPLGPAGLTVSAPGQADLRAAFTVVRNAPGLFQQNINGQPFAIATHEDGSPVTLAAPAKPGELLTLYGTGFGPTDHLRPAGFAIPDQPPFQVTDPMKVSIGDGTIQPENVFAAPGGVGMDALQFRLPDSSLSGTNAALHITVNGQDSNTVSLPVQ